MGETITSFPAYLGTTERFPNISQVVPYAGQDVSINARNGAPRDSIFVGPSADNGTIHIATDSFEGTPTLASSVDHVFLDAQYKEVIQANGTVSFVDPLTGASVEFDDHSSAIVQINRGLSTPERDGSDYYVVDNGVAKRVKRTLVASANT